MTDSSATTTRPLAGSLVHPVGLGCMPMSWEDMLPERERAIRTIHAALDAGCRHLDTSNIYAPSWDQRGHNEGLLAEALRSWSGDTSDLVVATKGGLVASVDGVRRDASASALRRACEESLTALGVTRIDLYYLHWPDPKVSFAQQVENLASLVQGGLVSAIGLSNVSLAQLEVAREVTPIAAVQNEYSPRYREGRDVMAFTATHDIAYLPWSPFGGADRADRMDSQYAAFRTIGAAHDVSAYQVALAWLLRQAPNVIPIPGSTRPTTITDSLAATDVHLTGDELAELDATVPEGTSQYPDGEPEDPPLR